MKLSEYKKLWALPGDIKTREKRIEWLLNKQEKFAVVQDTVQGSTSNFPYTKRAVTIRGIETEPCITAMQARLKALNDEYDRLYFRALIEIEDITDPEVRVAVSLHYMEGWNWDAVAAELTQSRDPEAIRKAVTRYFKKHSNQ